MYNPNNHQYSVATAKKEQELSAWSRDIFADALEIIFMSDSLIEGLLSTHLI